MVQSHAATVIQACQRGRLARRKVLEVLEAREAVEREAREAVEREIRKAKRAGGNGN